MATITWVDPKTTLPEIGKDIIVKYKVNTVDHYAKAVFSKVYEHNHTGTDFNVLVYFAGGTNLSVKAIPIKSVDGYASFYEGWEEDITPA